MENSLYKKRPTQKSLAGFKKLLWCSGWQKRVDIKVADLNNTEKAQYANTQINSDEKEYKPQDKLSIFVSWSVLTKF